MLKPIKITIAARCDKAAREHNEDNCLICSDVASGKIDHIGDGSYLSPQIDLGDKGCLLVVADGMGGMNAGEVASQMAVESVRKFFSKEKLDSMSLTDDAQISRLILDAIIYADACIKSAAVTDSGKTGMGTTIVVLWIIGRRAHIGWCGDSRIYRFNKQSKILTQLSKDHSYVQMLVDQHQITEEEAFDHPDSNVLLCSLGDAFEDISPGILRPLNLTEDDVFMMCSDGLCGVLRNNEIRSIMTRASVEYPISQLDGWHKLLWEHASKAGWHDNVTTVLCHIGNCPPADGEHAAHSSDAEAKDAQAAPYNRKDPKLYKIIALVATVVILAAIFTIIMVLDKKSSKKSELDQMEQVIDSTDVESESEHRSSKLPVPTKSVTEKSLPKVDNQRTRNEAQTQTKTQPAKTTTTTAPVKQPAQTSKPATTTTTPVAIPSTPPQPKTESAPAKTESTGASGDQKKSRSRL